MTTPTIKTHESGEPASGLGEVSCGICQRQISRYTCPSCNLVYCSLNCFRSELHSRCSESFYRKEIEVGIKSGSKNEGDRNEMLKLLKRMEDEGATDGGGLLHAFDEENEDDSLVDRFSGIDISSASAEDILWRLTKEEKDKFFFALGDSSSGLMQQLLESPMIKNTRRLPWWEASSEGGDGHGASPLSLSVPYGVRPDLMEVPTDLIGQASHGISLLYNTCAVLLSYAYVTRHLSVSPLALPANDAADQHEARRIISRSVPFLVDRRSTLCHASLTDAVLSFWSRLDPGSVDDRAMAVLLGDVARLVRPRRIVVTERSSGGQARAVATDHPSATTIVVISDQSSLFGATSHVGMKLAFYAAHVLSTPLPRLHALADEVERFSESVAKETPNGRRW